MLNCSGVRRENGRLQRRKLVENRVHDRNHADGQGKIVAQREVAQAQDAMLSGKMGACAMHLTKAMHSGMMK